MIAILTSLILTIVALLMASLSIGDVPLSWRDITAALLHTGYAPQTETIVLDLRLPRALLALLVGMGLGAAGALVQTVMRNPLAEPGILGINAGAALFVTVLIVAFPAVSIAFLPWAGFAGASATAALVYALSWRQGTSSLRVILIGIGVGSVVGAGTTVLMAFGDIRYVQRAMIWLAGSVHDGDWHRVRTLLLWIAPPLALACMFWRELDLIRLGDQTARALGQRVEHARGMAIVLCTLIAGAVVAFAGLIGFVGLVAPHIARFIAGPGHSRLLPVAALTGGVLVMAADLLGRTIVAPAQLPAGLVAALIGAPFFGWLLWRRRHVPA
ncbi:FecCD family ABC transporter permease [Pseudochelatococcus contaminans]|uniref:Iron complex transport system permease protein n=1 Tax=Pseudochelatococcus contaminans TaxID=1538103 RepID=A0A7W6EI14_9HYPH|nr:iron ABC transporter permease [Pseudochelatococcus contaminans]MBB3810247.1 iron complex transport system permease protein [Pseudochelatococcus contaminans]